MSLSHDSFLRRALLVDAAGSGATAILCIAGAGMLAAPLGLPEVLLREAGIILVPFVILLLWLARKAAPSVGGVKAVIATNILWVVASAALLLSGLVDPTLLGTAFVIAQALAVLVFAELQIVGVRRLASVRQSA